MKQKIVGIFSLSWCVDRIILVKIGDLYQVHLQKRDDKGIWKTFTTSPSLSLIDAKAKFAQTITIGLSKKSI